MTTDDFTSVGIVAIGAVASLALTTAVLDRGHPLAPGPANVVAECLPEKDQHHLDLFVTWAANDVMVGPEGEHSGWRVRNDSHALDGADLRLRLSGR